MAEVTEHAHAVTHTHTHTYTYTHICTHIDTHTHSHTHTPLPSPLPPPHPREDQRQQQGEEHICFHVVQRNQNKHKQIWQQSSGWASPFPPSLLGHCCLLSDGSMSNS